MNRPRRHLRSLLIAVGALALTAGLAVGRDLPGSADHGLGTATEAAGKTLPVGQQEHATPPGLPDAAPAAEHPENHGSSVSDAAQAETPDGYDNHGQYVSSVAKDDAGKPEASAKGQEHAAAAPGRSTSADAKGKRKDNGANGAPD